MANVSMLVPAGVSSVLGLSGTSYSPDGNGYISVVPGDINSMYQAGCLPNSVLYKNTTSTPGTTGTSEQTLMTYSLPASTLTENGIGLKIRVYGSCAANANNKTMKLYFGSEVITTPTAATNAKNWYLELEVYRTGSSAQVVFGRGIVDTTAVTALNTTGTETETSAIVIKVTGTGGTSGADITASMMVVEALY